MIMMILIIDIINFMPKLYHFYLYLMLLLSSMMMVTESLVVFLSFFRVLISTS